MSSFSTRSICTCMALSYASFAAAQAQSPAIPVIPADSTINQAFITFDLVSPRFLQKPAFVKEGAAVFVRYTGVNRYAVTANTTFAEVNRKYEDGLSALQTGLGTLTKAKEATAAADSSNKDMKTASATEKEKKDKLGRYLNAKYKLLNDIDSSLSEVNTQALLIKRIVQMDKDIDSAKNNPYLSDKNKMQNSIFLNSPLSSIKTPADFSKALATFITIINAELRKTENYIHSINSNMDKLGDQLPKEERAKTEKTLADLNKKIDTIKTAYSGANADSLYATVGAMAQNASMLLDQDFIATSKESGTASGDYIEISGKLQDNHGVELKKIAPFKIPTYGGRRIDFSVGVALNIGGQGKYSYDLRKNPTNATSGSAMDSVILIKDDQNRRLKFSPVIHVHWYKVSKCAVQPMLTIGLSPDFSDMSASRLSLGGGLGFNTTNELFRRIVLNAGVSVGYGDELKTKYKDLDNYARFGDLDASELTKKTLKASAFFSIGFNLGGSGHQPSTTTSNQ